MKKFVRLFFKIVRAGMTPLVIAADRLTTPAGISRSADEQARIETEIRALALYHFPSCPFCIKTRRAMKRLSLPITLHDAQSPAHREALQRGGGQIKVPCLRITKPDGQVQWMYESTDIIAYLNQRYAPAVTAPSKA